MVRRAQADAEIAERATSRKLGSLRALWPFLRPYRALVAAAVLALILTATISLVLPLAVRRVVDNFNAEDGAILDVYFIAALGIL